MILEALGTWRWKSRNQPRPLGENNDAAYVHRVRTVISDIIT
jgi:hypothetical protein